MSRSSFRRPAVCIGAGFLGLFCGKAMLFAQTLGPSTLPDVRPMSADLAAFSGRPIASLELVSTGKWFKEDLKLRWVRAGDAFSTEALRGAVRDLLDSGHIASARIEASAVGDKVAVKIHVDPRRVIATATVVGSPLPKDAILDSVGIRAGSEIVDSDLTVRQASVQKYHVEHGFPLARVTLKVLSTDDPLGAVLVFSVEPGAPARIGLKRFILTPSHRSESLARLLDSYGVKSGDVYDESTLTLADRALVARLRQDGYHEATCTHEARVNRDGAIQLDLVVRAGPRVEIRFAGNAHFDSDQLLEVLDLDATDDRSVEGMAERLRKHYIRYGFLDVRVTPNVAQTSDSRRASTFLIVEGDAVRVKLRLYPCLTGARSTSELDAEIDSFLAEGLPGSELFGAVDPKVIDGGLGPKATTGARPTPLNTNPYETYSPRVYERAAEHLRDLYRAEGYLSTTVGPPELRRRACAPGSQPGTCVPVEVAAQDVRRCLTDDQGKLLPEPESDPHQNCVPDLKRGRFCESSATLHIPIKLGPKTELWDVIFDGNDRITDDQLGRIAALEHGGPLSLAAVEQARRRVLDEYTERGFAYADVITQIEMSPDHSRARVRFSVREGDLVKVGAIIIRGAELTSEPLIRSRIALMQGKPYRRSLVRATEERLGTLGVFSTVRVGLEDAYVPAREKNVIVEVTERVPQYFEALPGFGTGEGPRLRLEFGNLNVGGKAIQFAARVRLSYLPDALILEPDVRAKYESDVSAVVQRLERTISVSAIFPSIGLGPQFRLGLEAFDVHDNARDFALTKEAAVVNLSYLTTRRLTLQLGGSLERNDIRIFGRDDQEQAIADYVSQNANKRVLFRVPAGITGVIAERFTVNWDRRDMPFEAHRGTFVTSSLEHVTAMPLYETTTISNSPFAAAHSEFLRLTSRFAGYLPLSKKGSTLAVSFRFGLNHQLTDSSRTYPDRLFFMGGIDSLRGFLQDSLIPEDIAHQLIFGGTGNTLTVDQVLIRGGNFFMNPRAELRLPVRSGVQTVLFLDAGNLWSKSPTDPETALTPAQVAAGEKTYRPNYLRLRYATGTGLRFETPIGPLVFDYGFNVERVLDRLVPSRKNQRTWEDLGAFHFTIGLF